MVFPASPTFVKTHTDAGGDSPASARAEINKLMIDVEDIIGSQNAADGVLILDGAGLIDDSLLPVIPIANGGTNADNAPDALTNLGAQPALGYVPVDEAGHTMTGNLILEVALASLILRSTGSGAVGSLLQLLHESTTPAVDDVPGYINFDGREDAASTANYARILAKIVDTSIGTYRGKLQVQLPNGVDGTMVNSAEFDERGVKIGTQSTALPRAGGTYFLGHTDAGNTAVTTEEDLITQSIAAGLLSGANKERLEVEAFGVFGATGNDKVVAMKFGATTLVTSGTVTHNAKAWRILATIIRTGAATQKAITTLFIDGQASVTTYTTPGETLAGAIDLKVTGRSPTTGAANDVVVRAYHVDFYPSP